MTPNGDTPANGAIYDPLYRLSDAQYSDGKRFEYVYDAAGNRTTTYTRTITSTLVTAYTYDAANRLTTAGSVPYTWDDNGNLTNDGSQEYTYDRANRLTHITGPGLAWSAAYNGDGARLKQVTNGSVTTYTLDMAALLPVALQVEDGGVSARYVYAEDTRPLAEYAAGGWIHYLPDGLGSVRQEVDAAGMMQAERSFDPYGVALNGDAGTPFGYTGEQHDAYTGLIFLRARYLQPELGMFLSRDPWGGDTLRPGSMNGWNYVEGNPVNFTDPTGAWMWGMPSGPVPIYHLLVEMWYAEGRPFHPNKQLEFYIPPTRNRVDMFNSVTGDVFEVEPWYLFNHGVGQVVQYVGLLNTAAHYPGGGLLTDGFLYNWNNTTFRVGMPSDWPGKMRIPLLHGPFDFLADYQDAGVVVYWLEVNPAAFWALVALGAWQALVPPNQKLVTQRGWSPGQPVLRPAYILSQEQACMAASSVVLVVAGGVVFALGITDNLVPGGQFDDFLTTSAGVYLINWGRKLVQFVPASVP